MPVVTVSQTCHAVPYLCSSSSLVFSVWQITILSRFSLCYQLFLILGRIFIYLVLIPNVPLGSGSQWVADTFENQHKTSQKNQHFTHCRQFQGMPGFPEISSLDPRFKTSGFCSFVLFQLHSHLGVRGRGQTVKHLKLQIYNLCVCRNLKIVSVMLRKIQITVFCLYNSQYVAIKIFAKNLEFQPYIEV